MSERPLNHVADLMDLRSRITTEGDDVFVIRSELRIGRSEIDDPVGSIVARRAFIHLELDGYDISRGNRLGEPVRVGVVEETKSLTEQVSTSSVAANAGISLASDGRIGGAIGAKAAASVEAKTKSQTSVKTKVERSYVKALGGDRWEISGDSSPHLDGTYITDDRALCQLTKTKGANRAAIKVSGYVLKRDLDFVTEKPKFDPLGRNKSQAIKAFLTKRVGQATGDDSDRLVISEQEITDE